MNFLLHCSFISFKVKTRAIHIIILLFLTLEVSGYKIPEKGVPLLESYYPYQYQNKGKVWDINSSPNGMVYMAADRGLLEFDGKKWNSFKGSTGFTRSLLIANDSLIYTGSDLDFGVWRKDAYNQFEYLSLYPFQKDIQQESEEFWDIHQQINNILFVSSQNIYVYRNEQLTKINAPSRFTGSFTVNNSIYFADELNGLYLFEDLSLKNIFAYPARNQWKISGVYPVKEGLGIATRNAGLHVYASGNLTAADNELSEKLKTSKVFSFERIGDMYLAFGTVTRGLYISDKNGQIIHHINRQKGLPGNTVLSLHYSASGKLWMGMDYGVSSLHLNNNLTYFYDYRGDFGTGYTALLKNDIFYLGTNQGLYRAAWKELNNNTGYTRFELIAGTEGQVWTLRSLDNTLLIGHDRGLFSLNDNNLEQISSQDGVWTILPYKDLLLTGNYNGVSILKKSGNQWIFDRKMELIVGSCNQLLMEKDSVLWVNIPNFGVIRAPLDQKLNPTGRLIFEEDIFNGSYPYLIKNEKGIQVITQTDLYTFDPTNHAFIQEDQTIPLPSANGLITGIYEPHSLDPEYNFFPIYNGFALQYLAGNKKRDTLQHQVIFRKTEVFNNDRRQTLHPNKKTPWVLNNIRMEYIVPNQDHVMYHYKTRESDTWSEWSKNNVTELLDLPFGQHTFWVQAKVNGKLTPTNQFSFTISAPWYQTWYSYIIYLLLIALLAFLIRTRQKSALEKQKSTLMAKKQAALQKQAEKHQQEIILMDKQRLQTEYKQLKQQLKSKTIELANKAREDEEKNRLLLALKEKCDAAHKNPSPSKRQWHEMQRLLDSYINVEDNTFEIQMDELHQEFFKKLKDRFPGLSSNDLRLCAYLRIGLNSKEIAEIMNIQPSSSYISRSRLRKKLHLKAEDDLYDFLNGI